MIQRLKAQAAVLVAVLLFAAGLWTYGVPPLRMRSGGSPAPASTPASTTSTLQAAGGRLVVTLNNGAPEDDAKRQAEQRLVREYFEKKYPDATLFHDTWQFSPDSFFAKYVGGTLTDVVGLFATEATLILDRRMSADITEEIRAWPLSKYLNPRMLDLISRDGRIYGLPVGGAAGGFYVMTLFYNVDMFRAAGLTDPQGRPIPPDSWEDFTTYAVRLTNRERGVAGFGILGETAASGWHFLNWVWQAGGDFERRGPDGRWKAVFDEPEAVRALQFIKDLRWKHDVLQRNVLATNDELFQLFSSDRIAMAIFTPEYLTYLVDKYQMPYEKIGICLLPKGPGGRANQIGGAFQIINPRLTGLHKQRAVDAMLIEHDLDLVRPRVKLLSEQGRRIGIPYIPIFLPEYQEKLDAIVNEYRNVPDLSDLMQEAAQAVRAEPPYRCQQLYKQYTGPAVQEVLVNERADPAAILRRAAARFQIRELDPINRDLEAAGLLTTGTTAGAP
ncbi:MAG: extracellular solute-binding protein [Candidatus Sumerlaeaceae bacterium]|nr:extracellular solute-binding protein [Candidatus Sumerlaeaceae bacterium]